MRADVACLLAALVGEIALVAAVLSTPLSWLSDKVGRLPILLLGYFSYACFYMTMGLVATTGFGLYLLFAGYGLFLAATEGVEKALVADLAPIDQRGTAFGWFNLIVGVMLLPASFVFGWIYQSAGSVPAFGFSAICDLGAAALLLTTSKLSD